VEALASLDSDKIHVTNCKFLLTWFPFTLLGIIDKGRGEVLVVVVAGLLILGIGSKVGSKGGMATSSPLHNLLHRIDTILVPCDCLLAWKMDLEPDNIGFNGMHLIAHQTPKSLALGN